MNNTLASSRSTVNIGGAKPLIYANVQRLSWVGINNAPVAPAMMGTKSGVGVD